MLGPSDKSKSRVLLASDCKSKFKLYLYNVSIHAPLAAPRQLYAANALTEKPTLPPLPLYCVNDFFSYPLEDPGFTDSEICENAVV